MTQKELEQKVIDAESRVAKREAVLKKHNSQLAKMIEKGADRFDVSIKREDIKSATSKLAEARETLANWKDKLNTRITRDAYLEANTPEILKDFLENWKQHAIGYYREKRIRFIEYREGLKAKERAARLEALQTLPSLEKYRELYKGRELTDYDLANLWPRRDVDAFLSERGLEYHQIQKKLREAGDQITLRLLEIRDEDEREAWLEKTMDISIHALREESNADEGRPPVMTTEERRALLDRAITAYGAPAQMDMAVEEMAELTKAICKIKRAQAGCEVTAAIGNVIEEMADVQIMLDQLRIIFHRSTEEVEEAKLERLKNRLDGRNNWQGSSLHKWIEKQFSTGGNGHE